MTQYPNQYDDNSSLPPATGDDAASVNANIAATEAIENTLGLLPAGVYASVRTRLDILEARINNPFAPAPNVNNPFYIGGSPISGVSIQAGFGDPGVHQVPAIPGSLFLREDGYANQALYSFGSDGYWHQVLLYNTNQPVINPTRTIYTNYVVDSIQPDYLILCANTTPISITLSAPQNGRQIVIKDSLGSSQTNQINIIGAGPLIDGASNRVIQTNYSSLTLMSDGANWFVI